MLLSNTLMTLHVLQIMLKKYNYIINENFLIIYQQIFELIKRNLIK